MADPAKIYHSFEKLINASGLGDVRSFFTDPESPEYMPPEPPPDPNLILAQAQAEALGREQTRKEQEMQLNAQTGGAKAQAEAAKAQAQAAESQVQTKLKVRELALKEIELKQTGALAAGEVDAKIANIEADTELKKSQSDKAMAEAAATAVEASDTFQQALKVVAEGGELNAEGDINVEFETESDEEDDDAE
jgi:hypothetical protein